MARRLFKFRLDENKPEEGRLIEYVRWLTQRRMFVTIIRRALLLVWTLDENDTSEFKKQYPLLFEQIRAEARAEVAPPDLSGIDDLKREMKTMQELMLRQGVNNSSGLSMKEKTVKISASIPDDDDQVVIHKDANAGVNVTANFLGAAFGFQGIPAPAPKSSGGIKEMKVPSLAMPDFSDDDDDDFVPVRH